MHLFLLALVFGILLHDNAVDPDAAATTYGWFELLAVTLLPKLMVGLGYAAACVLTRRRLGTSGAHRALSRLERLGAGARAALLGLYGLDLVMGMLTATRSFIGDPVLIDELLIMLPTLAVMVWMWSAYYPIDRRMREAAMIRRLDMGEPLPPIWTRGQYLLNHLRHNVALVLLPLLALLAWMDLLGMAQRRAWVVMPEGLWVVLQLAGVACVMLLAPLVIRHVWNTTPLPDGPLREHLTAMCRRHRVGVRELLLWHTFGGMINAAVMGLIAPVRYILLTDALLERMPREQVEAVMAHELAHVRRHHLFWLLMAAMGLGGTLELIAQQSVVLWEVVVPQQEAQPILVMASVIDPLLTLLDDPHTWVVLALGPAVAAWAAGFGWVSRRFERQADTFAVQHLVREQATPQRDAADRIVVDPASALVMIQALQAVADLNHIQPSRRSWRHGSIAWRQDYLRSIVGLPVDRLPIDRTVRRINTVSLVLVAAMGVAMMLLSA
jgi:STE24 endopeptidase